MSLLQTADVERILAELSRERPLFHSEADFQLALAFKVQQLYPQLAVRMEKTEIVNNERLRVDVLAYNNGQVALMELKYPTRGLRIQARFCSPTIQRFGKSLLFPNTSHTSACMAQACR
jgi:hypothetical protein